ncbi:unnamed protein product, partial [Brassica oleracea var. botrytis]
PKSSGSTASISSATVRRLSNIKHPHRTHLVLLISHISHGLLLHFEKVVGA